MHRAAQHGAGNRVAQALLGTAFELLEKQHHDVKETGGPAVDDGLLIHQLAAQQALDGAHQPALGAAQVGGQRGRAVFHMTVVGVEEQRGGQRGAFAFQRDGVQFSIGL